MGIEHLTGEDAIGLALGIYSQYLFGKECGLKSLMCLS